MQPIKDTDLYTDGQHTYRQKNQGDYVVYILVEPAAGLALKTVVLDETVVEQAVDEPSVDQEAVDD
jgi:hypothetical protein